MAQLDQFKLREVVVLDGIATTILTWLPMQDIGIMLAFVAATMLIIQYFPRITKKVPSTLIALVAMTILSWLLTHFDIYTLQTVQHFAGEAIRGTLPSFHIPSIPRDFETLRTILPYSIIA